MLTPVDIDNVRFRGALLGYDKREVEQFLVQVSRAMEEYATREREAQQKLAEAQREIARYRENENLIKDSMVLAQRTADDLIAAAKEKAAAAQHSAELETRQLQQQLARLRGDREQFEFAFHGLLTGFIRQLENSNPALAGQPSPAPALTGSVQKLEMLDVPAEPALEVESAPSSTVIEALAPYAPAPAASPATSKDEDAELFLAALATARPGANPPGSAA